MNTLQINIIINAFTLGNISKIIKDKRLFFSKKWTLKNVWSTLCKLTSLRRKKVATGALKNDRWALCKLTSLSCKEVATSVLKIIDEHFAN